MGDFRVVSVPTRTNRCGVGGWGWAGGGEGIIAFVLDPSSIRVVWQGASNVAFLYRSKFSVEPC